MHGHEIDLSVAGGYIGFDPPPPLQCISARVGTLPPGTYTVNAAFHSADMLIDDSAPPVTTGRDGMQTPTGTFSIYAKLKLQTMDGVTDGKAWVVPNVPNVMYINGGVALHGTYWHKLFGSGVRISHGCVNLPLGAAAWLYDWAPVGTPVKVTY